jgi:hypothetical protein
MSTRGAARPRAAALALALAACAGAPAESPWPRVLAAEPQGVVAPGAVRVLLTFSAPLDPDGLLDGKRVALCRREDVREVSRLAESALGLDPSAPVVPARARLDASGTALALEPAAPLAPATGWAAVLSSRVRAQDGRRVLDPDGKVRTFALLFETGPARDTVPPRAAWVLPPHGPAPANLAALQVAFDEPVRGALALRSAPARVVEGGPGLLGLELLGPLVPGALALDLDGVRDAEGNAAEPPPPLVVSACASGAAPQVGAERAVPLDAGLRLEASLSAMGRLRAEVAARPGEEGCGAVPAPPGSLTVTGEVAACPGHDPCRPGAVTCPAGVEVRRLCPGRTLRVRLASEDLAGHRGEPGAWREASAAPGRAALVLTEVLADPDAPEAGGEFAELANVGTGDAELAGLVLEKRTAAASVRCTLAPLAPGRLAPGAHALVVGGAYDGRYALPAGTPLYACGSTALAGGLANDRAPALALRDAGGALLTSAGWEAPAPRCAPGQTLARAAPSLADAAASWRCAVPSPGACNPGTPTEACPARPW